MDSLETFNKKIQHKVDRWKNEVEKVKDNLRDPQEDADRHQKIKDLLELEEIAYQKLAELQETSGDSWQDLYEDTQREWIDLEEKITKALESVK